MLQNPLPNDPDERIANILVILKEDFAFSNMIYLKGINNSIILFRCESGAVSEVLEKLGKIGIGITYGIIDVVELSVSIPEESIIKTEAKELGQRRSIEEIEMDLENNMKTPSPRPPYSPCPPFSYTQTPYPNRKPNSQKFISAAFHTNLWR